MNPQNVTAVRLATLSPRSVWFVLRLFIRSATTTTTTSTRRVTERRRVLCGRCCVVATVDGADDAVVDAAAILILTAAGHCGEIPSTSRVCREFAVALRARPKGLGERRNRQRRAA